MEDILKLKPLKAHHYVILCASLVVLVLSPIHAYALIQANDDVASVYQGLPGTIDVLQNDFDSNPTAIMNVIIVNQPLHGSAVYDPNTQLVTYTSSVDYYGPDSFTYQVDDGSSQSNTAQVSITVNQVLVPNTAPVAVSDTFTGSEGTPIILNVLANDYDTDGDSLTITSVTGPSHGTASILSDQTIEYFPFNGYTGTDSFSYTISDGFPHGTITTEQASISITIMPINHPPVAQTDFPITNENTSVKISVLANDYDPDPGDTISITGVGTPSHGTVVINSDQTISYTPSQNYYGSDSFTYTISDNHGATTTGMVNVIVHGLPNPVITNPTSNLLSNSHLQTISGTSEPYVQINLYDGTTLVGTTNSDSSGNWSTQLTFSSDGLHTITAKATDSSGTLSTSSNAVSITIDTTKPTITIVSPINGATINTSSFTISGTASDTNLQKVEVSIDSGSYQLVTGTTSWNVSISGLSNGFHNITARATDNAGNIQTTSIIITVQVPTNTAGKATTGQGSIGGTTNFSYKVQSSDGISISGDTKYSDKSNNISLSSISITSFSVDPTKTKASFSGYAQVNGKSGYTFSVYVEDNDSGKNDYFSIKIFDNTFLQIYSNANKLTQGNIQIHQ